MGTARFQVRRRLGAGGMGVVYEADDLERGHRVALKTIHDPSSEKRYRLKRKFRVLADLAHPNLATLYDLVVEDGACFFTMELIEGQDFLASRPSRASSSRACTRSIAPRRSATPGTARPRSGRSPGPSARPCTRCSCSTRSIPTGSRGSAKGTSRACPRARARTCRGCRGGTGSAGGRPRRAPAPPPSGPSAPRAARVRSRGRGQGSRRSQMKPSAPCAHEASNHDGPAPPTRYVQSSSAVAASSLGSPPPQSS